MDLKQQYAAIDAQTIADYLTNGQEENLHLDFKAVTNENLDKRDDRQNLAIALSAFANSDGGLVVWGVDARPNSERIDCASALKLIKEPARLLARLNEFTGQGVNPNVDGVEHRAVPLKGAESIVVTLVPASDRGPHMAKLGVDQYYKRSGSQFLKMEHFDIEDMFGRRRRPHLQIRTRLKLHRTITAGGLSSKQFRVVIDLHNEGRGSAVAPYVALAVGPTSQYTFDFGSSESRIGAMQRVPSQDDGLLHFAGGTNVVVHPRLSMPVIAVSGTIRGVDIGPPMTIQYQLAAENQPLSTGIIEITTDEIMRALRA
jgi:hypothetical protein